MSFVDTLGAKRRVELATTFVALTKMDIESAKRLLEAKLGTTPDILQAKIQDNNMSITHRNALTEYATARRKLAILVGQPKLDLSSLKGDIDRKLPKRDLEQSYEELLSVSPELKMAQARVARARAAIRRQKAQPIPNVTAQIGAGYDSVGGDEIASVQLAVPWPLFNKNAGNIDAAQLDYLRALQDVERQKLVLRLQLTEVFRQYLQARNEIERYQEELLATADENMSLTEKGYNRLNKFSILRLLTARRSYFDANLQYVQSLINLRRADVLIDGLLITGALNAPSDFSVNSSLRSQAFEQK
jgi:cobalt-zinc-cadmium efflux system outer membrane protein